MGVAEKLSVVVGAEKLSVVVGAEKLTLMMGAEKLNQMTVAEVCWKKVAEESEVFLFQALLQPHSGTCPPPL